MPSHSSPPSSPAVAAGPLVGWTVIITRPQGQGANWRRRFARAGARPLLLPGLALRATLPAAELRSSLQAAADDAAWIFTSPAAAAQVAGQVEHWPQQLLAIGATTAARVARLAQRSVLMPERTAQHSEGLLALPALQQVAGRRISLITGEGGRGLLQQELRRRGAWVRELSVYARGAPRLDRRHFRALQALPARTILLLSSAEAMQQLKAGLPAPLWQRLLSCQLVVSSARLQQLAQAAGFRACHGAPSALLADMQATAEELVQTKGCV